MKLLSTLLGLSLAQNEEERSLFGTEEINFDEQNRFLQEQRFAEEIKGLISGSLSCIAEVRENQESTSKHFKNDKKMTSFGCFVFTNGKIIACIYR